MGPGPCCQLLYELQHSLLPLETKTSLQVYTWSTYVRVCSTYCNELIVCVVPYDVVCSNFNHVMFVSLGIVVVCSATIVPITSCPWSRNCSINPFVSVSAASIILKDTSERTTIPWTALNLLTKTSDFLLYISIFDKYYICTVCTLI